MAKKNFNEVLKQQEAERQLQEQKHEDGHIALDDTQRVKVLSPGRLVFNRFIRNKLAIVGSAVLIFMFVFSFVFPLFYPYQQAEVFYKYDKVVKEYANASVRTEYTVLMTGDYDIHYTVKNNLNASIKAMTASGETESVLTDSDGNSYVLQKLDENIYGLYMNNNVEVCSMSGYASFASYNSMVKALQYSGSETEDDGFKAAVEKAVAGNKEEFAYGENEYRLIAGKKGNYTIERRSNQVTYAGAAMGEAFESALLENLDNGSFTVNGTEYTVTSSASGYTVYEKGEQVQAAYLSTYVFDAYEDASLITDEFRLAALEAVCGNGRFSTGGVDYVLQEEEDEIRIYPSGQEQSPVAVFSTIAVRAADGTDTLSFAFKEQVRQTIEEMTDNGVLKGSFEWEIPQLNENGEYSVDENGNTVTSPTTVNVSNENFTYVLTCEMVTYLIDIYGAPSSAHPIGTDGNGMDVLARMMYGGRVSLLVCFVVIIIETVLGVILGGIAGFFGGWIDNVIMRAVDVFYCIPSMPILIILGAVMDDLKMTPYVRLLWMMVLLGVLGWAGVARLVRGQILSLREQEFMVAAEAIGLSTSRRIFRHLVPNVLPQLIVTASNGLGSIIITEATLSFLGLGVKYPLATWGTMINSVTGSSEALKDYAYIWVPVGFLICLTVIAFNFVGDGLRDAFDPKMKR